jgi:hypothetical protein
MKHRLLIALLWTAIIFIIISAITIIVWLLYPYQVVQIKEPIRILNPNKEVAIGEPIIQELRINKPNDIPPANPTRVLLCEDGNLVTLAPLPGALNLPSGSYTLVNDRYTLPPKVSPGDRCIFVWTQTYEVNPIREIPVE